MKNNADKRRMVPTVCEDCETVFIGGPHAFLCPKCRKQHLSDAAKRRGLNKLGNEAYSKQQAEKKALIK